MTFRIRVTDVDSAPDELYEQTPFEASLLRKIPGPDRPDYWLAQLENPLRWLKDGNAIQVTHLILAARWVGCEICQTMQHTPINIAYVVNPEALQDPTLDFGKCAYVAIGTADAIAAA